MHTTLGGTSGYVPHHAHLPECPLLTSFPASQAEVASGVYAEPIKAYKLGKGRQSYNMLNVQLYDATDSSRRLEPTHAARLEQSGENAAAFAVQYMHGIRLKLVFHLAYSTAEPFQYQDQPLYQWRLVCRDHCHAGCPGPILRPISRLGRNGKHSNLPQNKQLNPNGSKDSRYVYLSIDEASSHIGSLRHTFFRLIVGAYDSEDGRLLGTSCSEPVACISNNDVPKNSPYLAIHIPVSSAWPKWQLLPRGPPPMAAAAAPAIVAAQQFQAPPAKAPVPPSPGRSASPRSATSMAYLSQPLPPAGALFTQQPSVPAAAEEWEDDSGAPEQPAADSTPGAHISVAEAAEDTAAAEAIAALQGMRAMQAHGPGSSGTTQPADPAPESVAIVPQAQIAQAVDDAELADDMHPYQPNPESYPCGRAKKMRLLSTFY